MMGYGYDMGAGGWIAMTIFWVGLITLVIWAFTRVLPTEGNSRSTGSRGPDDAAAILDRRFATGELDEDTYRSMSSALRESRATTRRRP